MSYKIQKNIELNENYGFALDWNGFRFLVFYGMSEYGWFVSIPNWNVSTECGEPWDTYCNVEKLANLNLQNGAAAAIASAIKKHWEQMGEE